MFLLLIACTIPSTEPAIASPVVPDDRAEINAIHHEFDVMEIMLVDHQNRLDDIESRLTPENCTTPEHR